MREPCEENGFLTTHATLVCESYRRWVGEELLGGVWAREALGRRLYEAPIAVLSHGVEVEPLFNYGNRLALTLFGYDWRGLVGLPSRLSAAPEAQEGREALLAAVAREGFVAGYRGVRVAADGRRFEVEGLVIWNLIGEDGGYQGQAAAFSRWRML